MGPFDCAETSYQTWDSNKLLSDFDRKNPPKKLSKSHDIDYCENKYSLINYLLLHQIQIFWFPRLLIISILVSAGIRSF